MNVELVGNKLIIDGFLYYHSKRKGSHRQWECVRLKAGECKARAVTNDPPEGQPLTVLKGIDASPHEHPPNFNECDAEKVKNRLKRKATAEPERPPSALVGTELSGLSQGMYLRVQSCPKLYVNINYTSMQVFSADCQQGKI